MAIPVAPCTVDDGLNALTTLCFQAPMVIGMHCKYWRGVCKAKVVVFAGSLDGGRLLFYWSPTTPTGVLDIGQLPSCSIDVGAGQRECELTVPWAVASNMLELP